MFVFIYQISRMERILFKTKIIEILNCFAKAAKAINVSNIANLLIFYYACA